MKRQTIFYLYLTIFCVFMIFGFSSQNGSQSSETSGKLTLFLVERIVPHFVQRSIAEQTEILVASNIVLREFAHIFSFFCLGISAELFYSSQWPFSSSKTFFSVWWKTFLFCVCIAWADECYQGLFVDGRTFQVIDLAKDWFGSAVGTAIIAWININMVKKIKKNKNKLLKVH